MTDNSICIEFESDDSVAADDVGIWDLLLKSFVVRPPAIDMENYYTKLFQSALNGSRAAKARTSVADYVTHMGQLRSEWPVLHEPDVFEAIDLAKYPVQLREQLSEELARIERLAPHADDEAGAMTFTGGCTTRAAGPLQPGTVMVRRSSPIATVFYPIPFLRLDQETGSLLRVAPALPSAPEFGTREGAELQRAWQDNASLILGTLSSICGAFTWIQPHAGPVFQVVQGVLNIVQLIVGATKEDETVTLLKEITKIVHDALVEQDIRKELANLDTFLNSFQRHGVTLDKSQNQRQYIQEEFLPWLDKQFDSTTGTLDNTVQQLYGLWQKTPWEKIRYIEEILKALSLAIAYKLLAHRTLVLLRAKLAPKDARAITDWTSATLDALTGLGYTANNAKPSARTVLDLIASYQDKRFANSSVYYGYKDNFLFLTWYVRDRLDGDRDIEWTNFWGSYLEGRNWAVRTRNAHYSNITAAASQNVLPMRNSLIKAIDGYYELNRQTRKEPVPRIDAGLTWTSGKAFFFNAARYLKYDVGRDLADASYPASNKGNWPGWPESFTSGIDAAVRWSDTTAYFFKGDEYISYDIANDRAHAGYPKKIKDHWGNWPSRFVSIDAAVKVSDSVAYFFKGDEYIRYNITKDRVEDGYPLKIRGNWEGWPADFLPIDGGVSWTNGCVYFFKGSNYIRYNISSDRIDKSATPIDSGWGGLRWW